MGDDDASWSDSIVNEIEQLWESASQEASDMLPTQTEILFSFIVVILVLALVAYILYKI